MHIIGKSNQSAACWLIFTFRKVFIFHWVVYNSWELGKNIKHITHKEACLQ